MDAKTNICRMVTDEMKKNATSLEKELSWFSNVLEARLNIYFGRESKYEDISEITPPDVNKNESMYANFIHHYQTSFAERIILVLSLIPYIRPKLLDVFFLKNEKTERGYSEFGGVQGNSHSGYIPTAETALFVLAGDNLEARFSLQTLFDGSHYFEKHKILEIGQVAKDEPLMSGALTITSEYLDYFTTGQVRKPGFSSEFPAKLISTDLDWEDLVLDNYTMKQINEIKIWMSYGHKLLNGWGLSSKIRPGYRSLFYGSPGTGKTMTACLLAKSTGSDVYKIDLSLIVSKYIGETEKNLSGIFDRAENKNWILFFDEADALFGKRTKVDDAHDKYANQEVSYLLQRIESYNGVVILASNIKSNLDEAFARRFESVIHFPVPKKDERLNLWKQGFSKISSLEDRFKLDEIAEKYELTGGGIMNVIRYASMMSLSRESTVISLDDTMEGIKREFHKEGRTI